MNFQNNKQSWPSGIISSELDLLESKLNDQSSNHFENLYRELSDRCNDSEKQDYLILLKIERDLHLGISVNIEDPIYCDFFNRRFDCQRVATVKVRALISSNRIQEAKILLCSLERTDFSQEEVSHLRARICLVENDSEGWLSACRQVIQINPLHKATIYLMASIQLNTDVEINALSLLKNYLEFEPLDCVMRSVLLQFLTKYGSHQEASDQREILSFLNHKSESCQQDL